MTQNDGPDKVFVKLRSLDTGKTASGSCATCHISQLRVGAVSHYDRRDMLNTPTETVLTFLKGQSYPVTVRNLANNLPAATANTGAPTTDARYTQQILPLGALPEFIVRDPQGLLGESLVWSAAAVAAKSATLIVPKVELTWQASGDNLALDDNTNAITGQIQGQRIFVGAKTPGEATEGLTRNTVMFKIKVTPPLPGTNVFLKAFDMDDTTDETFDRSPIGGGAYEAVIDPNGKAGNDNSNDYLSTPKSGLFVSNGQPTNTVTLDANSEALVEFRVGMQPGNNYRIAATVFTTNNLASLQVDEPTVLYFISSYTDEVRGGFNGAVSPILTVWRKLHLEIDSMTAPPASGPEANFVTGTVLNSKPNHPKAGQSLLEVKAGGALSEHHRFENGRLVQGGATNRVTGNWVAHFFTGTPAPGITVEWLVVDGVLGAETVGRAFTLYDDDDQFLTDVGLPSPPLPMDGRSTQVVQGIRPTFVLAYVDVVDANALGLNPRTNISFLRNRSLSLLDGNGGVYNAAKDRYDARNFWAHTLVFGYQPDTYEDRDPNGEAPELGITAERAGIYIGGVSIVFMEMMRETVRGNMETHIGNPAKYDGLREEYWLWVYGIAAHELGHAPGGQNADADHLEQELMNSDGGQVLQARPEQSFRPRTILRFRKAYGWSE